MLMDAQKYLDPVLSSAKKPTPTKKKKVKTDKKIQKEEPLAYPLNI